MGNKKQIEESLKSLILNDNRPFVAMLSGEWGVGKTYFWKEFTTNHLRGKDVVYISLFGQNSLADIETTIVTKLYKYNKTLKKYSKHLDTVSSMTSKALHLPINVSAGSILSLFSPGDFKNIVICFDDFERLSDKVPLKDVMGLISQFKEQKECKVVMILNEGELNKLSDIDGKKHDEVFALYKEKVVDYGFHYAPNHEEVFEAIKEDVKKIIFADHETIYQFFRETGLFNIRIMKQALYLLEYFKFIKDKEYDKKVVDEFIETALNLFVFKAKCNYKYSDFKKYIQNQLYIPKDIKRYSLNEEDGEEGDNDEKNKINEKCFNYYQSGASSASPNIDKLEEVLYLFLDKSIVDIKSLNDLFKENQKHKHRYEIREKMSLLMKQLWSDYSVKREDVANKISIILNSNADNISKILPYDHFEYYIDTIKEMGFQNFLSKDTEEKSIKSYIKDNMFRSGGIRNPMSKIKKKYAWADEFIENKKRDFSSTDITIDDAIRFLDTINPTEGVSLKSITLEVLSKEKYLEWMGLSQEFSESIESFIERCKHYGLSKNVENIHKIIYQALEELKSKSNDAKWRVEKLEERLEIDIKKELENLKSKDTHKI